MYITADTLSELKPAYRIGANHSIKAVQVGYEWEYKTLSGKRGDYLIIYPATTADGDNRPDRINEADWEANFAWRTPAPATKPAPQTLKAEGFRVSELGDF